MEKEQKKEEHHAHHEKFPSKSSMDTKTVIMAVLVGLLVLVSAVQSFELMGLKSKLSDEGVSLSKASAKTTVGAQGSGGGSSLSKNLDNLPSMVGGC